MPTYGLQTSTPTRTPSLTATQTPLPTATPEPTPVPLPTTSPQVRAAYFGGVEEWRTLAEKYFEPWNVQGMLNIMRCESDGNPNATGRAGERGLFQIHPLHFDSTYDPEGNIAAASRISARGYQLGAWDGPTPGRAERWFITGVC